ncbi:MAG: hypothetical protein ABEI74_04970 [Candidatus Pacearchaeota archaeon]
MGALRVISIILVTIILIPILIVSNLFLTFSTSYDLDNIVEKTKPILEKQLGSKRIDIDKVFQKQCSRNQKSSLNTPLGKVPCSKIQTSENKFRTLVKHIYNKDHNCDFINCYTNVDDQSILISEKTDKNLGKVSRIAITASMIFILLGFLSFRRTSSFLLYAGILILAISPLSLILKDLIPQEAASASGGAGTSAIFQNAIGIFLGGALTTFLIWSILAVLLIGTAISIRMRIKRYA